MKRGPKDYKIRNLSNRGIGFIGSTFLQELLYYQIFFSIAWIVFWAIWIWYKYYNGKGLIATDADVVRTMLQTLWGVFEPIRLFAGWYGNLQENLVWLIIFIVLTFIPMHATIYYIMLQSYNMGPISYAVQIAQAIITETEFFVGIYAAVMLSMKQRRQYALFDKISREQKRDAVRLSERGSGIGRYASGS